MVIQSVAIRRHTRHEDTSLQTWSGDGFGGLFDLNGRGAALPIVDVIIDELEFAAVQSLLQRLGVVSIADEFVHLLA